MHINRITKELRNKIVAIVLVGMTLLGTFVGFKHQQNKINDLQYQLEIKQQVEERASDYTISSYDTKNIEFKFNEIKEYKVMSSTISMKHKYLYEDEAFLGFHRKATLTANANIYFQYNVSLATADIKETNDEITITLSKAYLDKDTVHIVPNTFVRIEDECSHNILSNYEQGRKVQQYWTESAIDNSYKHIEEYFDDSCKVEAYTKEQVKELVQTLTNKNVVVNIK
jgi:hypothetical protein